LTVFVYMVNNLRRFKIASKMFLHNKTMNQNFTRFCSIRVFRQMFMNIAIAINSVHFCHRVRNLSIYFRGVRGAMTNSFKSFADISFVCFRVMFPFINSCFAKARCRTILLVFSVCIKKFFTNRANSFALSTKAFSRTIFLPTFRSIKYFITSRTSFFHILSLP